MWIVSLRRLREFWAIHPRAEVSLRAWFTQASAADGRKFSDVRATFATADLVGNCTIFNIAGNNYRLITRLFYASHKLYVLRIMTHSEYDRDDWPAQCGCDRPPPPRRTAGPKKERDKRPLKRRGRS